MGQGWFGGIGINIPVSLQSIPVLYLPKYDWGDNKRVGFCLEQKQNT